MVVSVTPLPVEKDSRAYKAAASAQRFGYRSILWEGKPSAIRAEDLPFELQTVGEGAAQLLPPALQGLGRLTLAPYRLIRFLVHYYAGYVAECVVAPYRSLPDADLYYLHAPYYLPAVLLRCLKNDARFVYDAHDLYSRLEDPEKTPATERYFVQPFHRLLEGLAVLLASEAVTVSEGLVRLHEEAYGRRLDLLRNVHDARLERPVDRTLREQIGLPAEAFLLVAVGNIKAGQAVLQAVEALGQLPGHVHLAFLGGGQEKLRALLEDPRWSELRGRVHLIPPVKPFEVVAYLAGANAALVTYLPESVNYRYCLPNRFFQPIAAGLPVLCPPLPEMRALCERFGFGLPIDPTKASSIAGAVRRLLEDEDLHAELSRRAAAGAAELCWEREETLLERLLERATTEPRRPRRGRA